MFVALLRRFALLGLVGLTICGCKGASKTSAPAPLEATKVEETLGLPAGWDDAVNKSGELYRAGKYAESIAVLEAFAKAHPQFGQVEIHLGDSWQMDREELGPLPARLATSAAHYRRALELATDDFDRTQATSSLLRVYRRQVLSAASLPIAEQRQLIAGAGSLADDVLKNDPKDSDALEIKSMIAETESRLKK